MWWAGLRGAIAFALALNMPGDNSNTMIPTTLAIVIFTTVVLGGATDFMVGALGLKRASDATVSLLDTNPSLQHNEKFSSSSSHDDGDVGEVEIPQNVGGVHLLWKNLDHKFFKPFFGGEGESRSYRLGMDLDNLGGHGSGHE